MDAIIPANGPDIAKSNIAALFFGKDRKVVTLLVIPVIMDGTNVGGDSLNYKTGE